MTTPSLSDADLLAALDRGEKATAIAERAGVTPRTIERRILKLAAMRAGSAVRAAQRSIQEGLDHAAGYLLVGSITLDRIVAMTEEAEDLDANRQKLSKAITAIVNEHDGDTLFTRDFYQMLVKATQPRDPDNLLFKAVDIYQRNIALYAEVYEKMANARVIAQLKELILSLMDSKDLAVRAVIEQHLMRAEAVRGLLSVDRYHPEPDRTVWDAEADAAFAALPHPSSLPDARAIAVR